MLRVERAAGALVLVSRLARPHVLAILAGVLLGAAVAKAVDPFSFRGHSRLGLSLAGFSYRLFALRTGALGFSFSHGSKIAGRAGRALKEHPKGP